MGSLSSFNCGVRYLLCLINVLTKYAWVKPLKEKKKSKTAPDRFTEIVRKSKPKPSK